jgi:hypothetical protein
MLKDMTDAELERYAKKHVSLDSRDLIRELLNRWLKEKKVVKFEQV